MKVAARVLGLALLAFLLYANVEFLLQSAQYDRRAAAAQNNVQFVAAYNMRRSGDIITIVGRAMPVRPSERLASDQYAWLAMDNGMLVGLEGAAASFCNGDDIVASGTYRYDASGGALVIADSANVTATFHRYADRVDRAIRALDPSWCGFYGLPVNNPYGDQPWDQPPAAR